MITPLPGATALKARLGHLSILWCRAGAAQRRRREIEGAAQVTW